MTGPLDGTKLHLVETMDEAESFLSWLGEDRNRSFIGVDTETSGLGPKDYIRLCQFGDARDGWAIPYNDWRGLIRIAFERIFQRRQPIAFHNAKYDVGQLTKDGVMQPDWRYIHDSVMMAFLLQNQDPRGLKQLADRYVDPSSSQGEKRLKAIMTKRGWTWETIPLEVDEYWQYGALDSVLQYHLTDLMWKATEAYRGPYDLEMACTRVLLRMEQAGVRMDRPYVDRALAWCEARAEELKEQLATYDIKDPNRIDPIVGAFAKEGITVPVKRSKKSGKRSLDKEVLEGIEHSTGHPLARLVLDARETNRNIKTYFRKFIENEGNDGRLHSHINQLEARSGRMSVTQPALHQLSKTAFVRNAILADEGSSLLLVDYQNEELRLAASLCNSPAMIEAFAQGLDMHRNTASEVYGIPFDEVSGDQRQNTKRALFAKAYGGREQMFATHLGIPLEEATRIFQAISKLYPEMDDYMENRIQTVKETRVGNFGHIFLSDGRKIHVPSDGGYRAFSYTTQGEGAITIKRSLVNLEAAGFGDLLRLPVHDEIMFEVPDEDLEEVQHDAMALMTVTDYTVPLTTDSEVVKRWGDAYHADHMGGPDLRRPQ